MEELRLFKPSIEYAEQIAEYKAEFSPEQIRVTYDPDRIPGMDYLENYNSIPEWLCFLDTVKGKITWYMSVRMSDGKIIDTVVHTLAGGLGSVPTILQAPAMLIANTVINVFLTSGSGQAAAVMPIMVPLSDLIGVTRQTAILAFNFGDGFCNYILPTSTALMGIISACNIPYDRWMRFMWKIFILWLIVGTVLLIGAQLIHFGPM